MNRERHFVTLSTELLSACLRYAEKKVRAYRDGVSPRSKALASRGAECSVPVQFLGRKGECAFCLWARLDPLTALHWDEFPDDDWDVHFNGWRVDVKATTLGRELLIWPANKTHLLEKAKVDVLALARGEDASFEICGVISKRRFLAEKIEATGDSRPHLDRGTWYVREITLTNPHILFEMAGLNIR